MTIGRDVLVIAGNFVSWAPITYGSNLFASNLWISGNNVAVLGGTAVLIGGVMLSATGVQLQIGFGCQTFVGRFAFVIGNRKPILLTANKSTYNFHSFLRKQLLAC